MRRLKSLLLTYRREVEEFLPTREIIPSFPKKHLSFRTSTSHESDSPIQFKSFYVF